MKPKPLDLEKEEFKMDEVTEASYSTILRALMNDEKEVDTTEEALDIIGDFINGLKDDLKQRIKSACEFYLRYKDKPDLFGTEHPEYFEEMLGYAILTNKGNFKPTKKYNEWLFKLAFKDVYTQPLEDGGQNQLTKWNHQMTGL